MNHDPETGQIKQIYQQPTGATDAMMWIMVFVRTEMKNTVKMKKKLQTQSGQKNDEGSRSSSVETKAVETCGSKEHN